MLDKVGPAVTVVSGAFVLAGQIIDQVNTTAEAIAVLLFAGGVLLGALRALRAGLRAAVRINALVTLLETLEDRLIRIEKALGLDPAPRSSQQDREAA